MKEETILRKTDGTACSPSIITICGNYFDYTDPEAHQYSIGEIAHALARECRFGNHTIEHYSVAQHSVMASYIVPPEDAYEALMHDAAEAFTGDIPRPLKQLLGPTFKAIEKRIEAAVFAHFGVRNPLPESVKHADIVMLATEQRDLLARKSDDGHVWALIEGVTPLADRIEPWSEQNARRAFMSRYFELIS